MLCPCCSLPGGRVTIPTADENRWGPVFGALNTMTCDVATLLTTNNCRSDFLDFAKFPLGKHEAEPEPALLFPINCWLHHTRAVRDFHHSQHLWVCVMGHSAFTPNSNLTERFWTNCTSSQSITTTC